MVDDHNSNEIFNVHIDHVDDWMIYPRIKMEDYNDEILESLIEEIIQIELPHGRLSYFSDSTVRKVYDLLMREEWQLFLETSSQEVRLRFIEV